MLGTLNVDEIEQLLTTNVVGRIGCYARGEVYVVPVTYVYDGRYIIGHTAEGKKIRMLRENPECCFETDRVQHLADWQSVIVQGSFEELHGDAAAEAMHKLTARLMPLMSSEAGRPSHGLELTHRQDTKALNAVVYRIHPKQKTGRFEKR